MRCVHTRHDVGHRGCEAGPLCRSLLVIVFVSVIGGD